MGGYREELCTLLASVFWMVRCTSQLVGTVGLSIDLRQLHEWNDYASQPRHEHGHASRPRYGRSSFVWGHYQHPSILLYEKDPSAAGGYLLVGVSYLLNAPEGADGQPPDSPFPKSLASWHRHANICVLADRSVKSSLTADQCASQGGNFTAETQWMIHAWIWKDSPAGVFSPTNRAVR